MDNTDFYYFHNIKADALLSIIGKTNIDWLCIAGNGFSCCENRNKYRFWPKTAYFPITVLRKGKPWANFDVQRLKLHVVTRGDFKNQLDAFVSVLKSYLPDLTVKDIKIKYVEICTRYPDKHYNAVSDGIKRVEARFFTTIHADGEDRRIKGKTWLTIGKELFVDKNVLNIKTYRFIVNFGLKKRTISELILPKIEVQIYKPKSLEEAKSEAIPIIKSFQKYIGFETESMSNESDYRLIQDGSLFSHNEKLFNCLKENTSIKAVKFPKEVTKDELTHKVACFITPEAKSSQEIMSYFNISRSTLQRVLNKLKPYLEKRGNNAGIYYQIDTNLIEQTNLINKDRVSCVIKHRVNSNTSNKSKSNDSNSSVSITVEKQPTSTKPVQTTTLRSIEITNGLANSALSIGLNGNISTNQKLNIQVLKGGEQNP
ncbi:MAG: hypothetical protein ACD_22C00045G0002 [uncultured bacterium]|nr:MAG: hypothetical protein ACD_22C00045G0002 [uncultured bacterium]